MAHLAQIVQDPTTKKWQAIYRGEVLASSMSKDYVERSIAEGRCNKAKKLGVVGVEKGTVVDFSEEESPSERFSINERFEFVENLVSMIISNTIPSLIVTGEGGLGKTHTVMKIIDEAKLVNVRDWLSQIPPKNSDLELDEEDAEDNEEERGEDRAEKPGDYIVVKGFSTAKGMYRTLFENRSKIIIYDDCDNILKDPVALMLLKGALDSYDERWISWNAEGSIDDGLPRTFRFTGRVIFISNLPLMRIDQAVRSRAVCVDIHMTQAQKIERMREIIKADNNFMDDYNITVKEDSLNFIEQHITEIKELNLRTLMAVIKIRGGGKKNWQRLAEYVITM